MIPDLYTTCAQVLPVLMLALLWESRFLERIQNQSRRPRRVDGRNGVRFWTKPRVRVYASFVATMSVLGTAVAILVLAGLLTDRAILRVFVCGCILLTLATLLTRTLIDIAHATRSPTEVAEAPPSEAS